MGCHLLHDVASKMHTGTTLSLLKADRLEAYPTFAMLGCAAKPAAPSLRKTAKPLGPPLPTRALAGGEGAGGGEGVDRAQGSLGSRSRAEIKKVSCNSPMRDGGLRGKARFTHPTENRQAAWPPLPTRALTGGEGAGGGEGDDRAQGSLGSRSRAEIRLFVFSPEGGTSLPVCESHRILAPTQPFYVLPMHKHLYQILRNSIPVLFSKHMLGLKNYHCPQCVALRASSLSRTTLSLR